MTPQPTPYDITSLPIFPTSPSVLWWLVLAILIIIAIAVVAAKSFESNSNSSAPSLELQFKLFQEQLRSRLSQGEIAPQCALDQLSSRLRSVARVRLGPDAASASVEELIAKGYPAALGETLRRIELARFSREPLGTEEVVQLSLQLDQFFTVQGGRSA